MRPALATLLIALLAPSCEKPATPTSSPEEIKLTTDTIVAENDLATYRRQVRSLFNDSRFEELETIANQTREQKLLFVDGEWKIAEFYSALECSTSEPDSRWKQHEQIYLAWKKQYPDSITAHAAHGNFMVNYAWYARGYDWAENVEETQFRVFAERLRKAIALLEPTQNRAAECPQWYLSRLRICRGLGESYDDMAAIFRKAKAAYPAFYPFDASRATYLLPRWYGEEGDWEAAALHETTLPDGGGLPTYAQLLISHSSFFGNLYEETEVKWDDSKKAFEALLAQHSDSSLILNHYARNAAYAGAQKTAATLFERIGTNKHPRAWRNKNNEFERAREWATTQ